MHITVIGTGYVGLTSAVCFAEMGHTVVGVDIDPQKVSMLSSGKSPIFEPDLEALLQKNIASGRLSFSLDLSTALPHTSMVFSAVATPPGEGYKADLRAVFAVAKSVAEQSTRSVLFINKSTVPVGTGAKCQAMIDEILASRGVDFSLSVASNPEFLREGFAVSDTLNPDRIVVGLQDENDAHRSLFQELYAPITEKGSPLLFMRLESAEIVKYASNSFLATKISFINMLTEFCEKTGADIRDIAEGMGLDDRIGKRFLQAGIGYGGSCFPKDVKALLATAEEYGLSFPIVEATDHVNTHQRERFIAMMLSKLPPSSTVAVLGLAFKPDTDDMREAPSIDVVTALIEAGHTVRAYDPQAIERAKTLLPSSTQYGDSIDSVLDGADVLLLLTEWKEFETLSLDSLAQTLQEKMVFDARLFFDPQEVKKAGLEYYGIGVG